MLYVVSTPIGNLKDITLRAIEVLRSVDVIAAEDTRHTRILCKEYDIPTPLISFFEHNERAKVSQIVSRLEQGQDVALVSDAGTPGINDPGFRLIREVKGKGLPVTVVPGACAVIAGLTLSGLPTDEFTFKGFLPMKSGQRCKALEEVKGLRGTVVFYASPHRLVKELKDVEDVLADPVVVVVRELTKKFEERLEMRASDLQQHFLKHKPKGEFVLLIPSSRK